MSGEDLMNDEDKKDLHESADILAFSLLEKIGTFIREKARENLVAGKSETNMTANYLVNLMINSHFKSLSGSFMILEDFFLSIVPQSEHERVRANIEDLKKRADIAYSCMKIDSVKH